MTKESRKKKIIPDEMHKPQYLAPHEFTSNTASSAAVSKQHEKSSAQWVLNCPTTEDKTFRYHCQYFHETSFHNISTATAITSGTAVVQWLRCCATNQKVAGSIAWLTAYTTMTETSRPRRRTSYVPSQCSRKRNMTRYR